jgi:uncharacterized OsmC-like protein
MQTTVSLCLTGNLHCETALPSGATLSIDPALRRDQPGAGPSPLDLLALAHGACMTMMLAKAAKQQGWDVSNLHVSVTHEYGTELPTELLRAVVRFRLPHPFGAAEQAILRAGAETCPIHRSLRAPVEIQMECPQ